MTQAEAKDVAYWKDQVEKLHKKGFSQIQVHSSVEPKQSQVNPEEIARAALCGFFGNSTGFTKMDTISRKRAITSVKLLIKG